jgi:hypothetical protein
MPASTTSESASIRQVRAKSTEAKTIGGAEVLEVGTMSLYTHVPGKAEVTDLTVDAVRPHRVPPPSQLRGHRFMDALHDAIAFGPPIPKM